VRLKTRDLLNYYSHHQANPYEWGSIGDVIHVWGDFKEFREMFKCHACHRQLKYDESADSLYCTCGGTIRP
jgi:hypothetical protein